MEQETKKIFMWILKDMFGEEIPNKYIQALKTSQFKKPEVQEVYNYMKEYGTMNPDHEANAFHNFYSSKGWKVGKNTMKDWKAAVRNWSKDKRKNKLIV